MVVVDPFPFFGVGVVNDDEGVFAGECFGVGGEAGGVCLGELFWVEVVFVVCGEVVVC